MAAGHARAASSSPGEQPAMLKKVSRTGAAVHHLILFTARLVARFLWRFEVSGKERVPSVGPFILCAVHRSYVDFLIVGMSVPRRMRYMGKDSLWRSPALGRFIEAIGAFPVDRDGVDRTALRRAEEAIGGGEPLVMFPEGRRRTGPDIAELQQGPAFVACRNRVPIVPVGIGGSDRAMPIGSKMVRPAKVRVVIGEPIYPDVPLEGRVPRSVVENTTEELRVVLQRLYDSVR